MPFCPKCGTEYQEGTKFCGKCGENVNGEAVTTIPGTTTTDASATSIPAGTPAVAPAPVKKEGPNFFQKLLDTKDYTEEIGAEDIKQNKVIALLPICGALAYILFHLIDLGLLGFVVFAGLMVAPCLTYKKSAFVRFQLAQIYVAFFGVLLFGIIDGPVSNFFYHLIAPSSYEIIANNALLQLGAGDVLIVIRTILGFMIESLMHIIFLGLPVFTLVVGLINIIKNKAKAMPFIGKIKVTFEK